MDPLISKVLAQFGQRYAIADITLNQAKEMLGLPTASMPSFDEIQKAYRVKAFPLHPDRFQDPVKKEQASKALVQLSIAKNVLEGKDRPAGPLTGWRPDTTKQDPYGNKDPADRAKYEEYKRKQEEREKARVHKGVDFATAKSRAPTGVEWKFRSALVAAKTSEYVKEQDPTFTGYVGIFACYGQTANHHVFMLAEHATPNSYSDVLFNEWAMDTVQTYPLSMDIAKLAPKALKAILSKGKLSDGVYRPSMKWVAMEALTEKSFAHSANGVTLKDILIGQDLVDDTATARKMAVELTAQYNPIKKKEYPVKYTMEGWKWCDFTLLVNGKPFPLDDRTIDNLFGDKKSLFTIAVYANVGYDFTKRRVLTKIPGWEGKILEMVRDALTNEPEKLKELLQKAINAITGETKTADMARRVMSKYRGIDKF